ncbi:MAG: phosphotransferase [Chloroflexi bacterium]|nr:phosphotransferase [Chloroflexota bacterium]
MSKALAGMLRRMSDDGNPQTTDIAAEIIEEAARRFEIEPGSLAPLGGLASRVFAGIRGGREVVLKVTPASYRSVAMVRSEIEFVRHMRAGGVPAAESLHSVGGVEVEEIAEHVARVEARLPGRLVEPREWTPELFGRWGILLGKMHALTKTFGPVLPEFTRPDWQEEMREDFSSIPDEMSDVRTKGMEVIERLDGRRKGPESWGLIHGDMHQWNLIWDEATLRPLDFDNSSYDWLVADISVIVHNVRNAQGFAYDRGDFEAWTGGAKMERREFARHFLQAFMSGYERENALPEEELDMLPDLLRRRHLSGYLDRVADARVMAMSDEEQAAGPPYRSVARQRAEILDDGFWEV